jgi:hypothetical protein
MTETTATLSLPRAVSAAAPRGFRSAVTNGSRIHLTPVGDNTLSRRFRDVFDGLAAQFGAVDEVRLAMCRTVARATVFLEQADAATLRGEPVNGEQIARWTREQRLAFNGLARAQKRAGR